MYSFSILQFLNNVIIIKAKLLLPQAWMTLNLWFKAPKHIQPFGCPIFRAYRIRVVCTKFDIYAFISIHIETITDHWQTHLYLPLSFHVGERFCYFMTIFVNNFWKTKRSYIISQKEWIPHIKLIENKILGRWIIWPLYFTWSFVDNSNSR